MLIDPYLSRIPLARVSRRAVASDEDLVERLVPSADAVLVGHTHFDHAIDLGTLARRHACPVYGSASAAHLLALHGIADLAVDVDPYRPYEIGPFTVRFTPSRHSKLVLGLKVPSDSELTCDALDDLAAATAAGRSGASPSRWWASPSTTRAVPTWSTTRYGTGAWTLSSVASPAGPTPATSCPDPGRPGPQADPGPPPPRLLPRRGRHGLLPQVNLGAFAESRPAAPGLPVRTLDPLQTVSAARPDLSPTTPRDSGPTPPVPCPAAELRRCRPRPCDGSFGPALAAARSRD